jgi:hypothetical protein
METQERERTLPGVAAPTRAEFAAAVLSGTVDLMTKGELVPITGRVPSWVMAVLDAMATRSGKSRNYVVNLVLATGLDAVQEHMSEEVRAELHLLSADAMSLTRSEGRNVSGEL